MAMRTCRLAVIGALLAIPPGGAAAQTAGATSVLPQASALAANDYPTDATVDYVFGCMQANGNTPKSLERCSCSFDVVASIVPFTRYVEASTFLSMGQVTGEKGVLFRSGAESKNAIGDLRRAQAEAEIRCFE